MAASGTMAGMLQECTNVAEWMYEGKDECMPAFMYASLPWHLNILQVEEREDQNLGDCSVLLDQQTTAPEWNLAIGLFL